MKTSPEPAAPIPRELDQPCFIEAWSAFVQHRLEMRPKCELTATGARTLLKRLLAFGPNRAADMLERAIANGYRGVIFAKDVPPKSSEQLDEEQRRVKRAASAALTKRQDAADDMQKRVKAVRDLPELERERLHRLVVARAPENLRKRMLEADPCAGRMLTMLIYAQMQTEEKP